VSLAVAELPAWTIADPLRYQLGVLMDDFDNLLASIFRLSPGDMSDSLSKADVETWDSLSHIELVVTLEKAYAMTFTGDEIADMTSVGAIRAVLERHLGAR
jgi:acyl carrier protein